MVETGIAAEPQQSAADALRGDAGEQRARLGDDVSSGLEDRGEVARSKQSVGHARQLGSIFVNRKLGLVRPVRDRNPSAEIEPSQIREITRKLQQPAGGLDQRLDRVDARADMRMKANDFASGIFDHDPRIANLRQIDSEFHAAPTGDHIDVVAGADVGIDAQRDRILQIEGENAIDLRQ